MRLSLKALLISIAGSAAVAGLTYWSAQHGYLASRAAVAFDANDLGGLVTGPRGPEAGVWVIAETTDLPTKFARIVVTDDRGRYVVPDLPPATYTVWVRGYGLVDSAKQRSTPGNVVNLTAVPAPSPAAAAEYYPATYWYSLLRIPDKTQFPGTGIAEGGNGIPENMTTQGAWLEYVKIDGCLSCHQLGNKATRTFPPSLGKFESSLDAWTRRIQSGQASSNMVRAADRLGAQKILGLLAEWSDRIAQGELPQTPPPRPQGLERNIVITLWDWSRPTHYIDDQGSGDRRDPHYNGFGPIFGAPEVSSDIMPVLDPRTNSKSEIKLSVRDPATSTTRDLPMFAPSPYWGDVKIWDSQGNPRHAMFDRKGRVWVTTRIRNNPNPAWCKRGSAHPSARAFPLEESERQLAMYDLATKQFTLIDTCFNTHHMYFDANGVIWFSAGVGPNPEVGWLDTNKFDATHDEQASQGWTAVVVDTNGNGVRDPYVEPGASVIPARDKRFDAGFYAVSVSPTDGAIWGTNIGYPGAIVRLVPGADPTTTALAEYYQLPWNDEAMPGFSPRGIDVDQSGVAWVSLISGHLASFDRRKCQGPLTGPDAVGAQCREGWTLHPFPGPQFAGVADKGSAEGGYFTYVDRFDTSGFGQDAVINTGNNSDALFAFVNGRFVTLRVPYPLGFYAKAVDGRIDDPNAGWKGKGLWSAFSARPVWHFETGKGQTSKVVHFQLRPDPLAH
jgi:hypothetical protein